MIILQGCKHFARFCGDCFRWRLTMPMPQHIPAKKEPLVERLKHEGDGARMRVCLRRVGDHSDLDGKARQAHDRAGVRGPGLVAARGPYPARDLHPAYCPESARGLECRRAEGRLDGGWI